MMADIKPKYQFILSLSLNLKIILAGNQEEGIGTYCKNLK